MKKNKLISLLSLLTMGCVTALPFVVACGDASTSSTQNIKPIEPVESDIVQTDMFKFNKKTGTILGFSDKELLNNTVDLIIPNEIQGIPIVAIGKNAFVRKSLESVIIPKKISKIGSGAFAFNNLTSITIPEGVKKIGELTFFCNILESVNIPNSVIEIEDGAFAENKINDLKLSDNLISLGKRAFFKNRIQNLTIPKKLKIIEEKAFEQNKIVNLNIPNNITTIGSGAFYNNHIKELVIPENVSLIKECAFIGNNITSIQFPKKNDFVIESAAFGNNKLSGTLHIPKNMKLKTTETGFFASPFIGNAIEVLDISESPYYFDPIFDSAGKIIDWNIKWLNLDNNCLNNIIKWENGKISLIADLPALWNSKYLAQLGINDGIDHFCNWIESIIGREWNIFTEAVPEEVPRVTTNNFPSAGIYPKRILV